MKSRKYALGLIASWKVITFVLLFQQSCAVDRGNFKTCEQSAFCKRHRSKSNVIPYYVDPNTVQVNKTAINAVLVMANEENRLRLTVLWLEDSRLRVQLDEAGNPLRQRYHSTEFLDGEPNQKKFFAAETSNTSSSFVTESDRRRAHRIVLNYRPFRLDIFAPGPKEFMPVVSINSRQLLRFEHFRKKEEGRDDGEGFWEETFKGHTDSKPFGSSSVGLDISFIGYKFVYGLPEHADSFALRSTGQSDPYRFYNLDVFEYELNNGMALYGSIPFVVTPSAEQTIGALWLNPSETWVDVESSTADKGVLASLIAKLRPSQEVPQVDLHFISETGLIDLFFFLGPRPRDVARQNAKLTGHMPLPPLTVLGYHQCRWNYNDRKDLLDVHDKFDQHDIPVDVLWLDIEYTDGKRYFTWDQNKFPEPRTMIEEIEAKGRRLVVIIDPHLKADDGYPIYREARDSGYFVKKPDGQSEYQGHCWPGNSAWLDYLDPIVHQFWSEKFASLNGLPGSTERLWIWNDMNEPSVFNGPEVTMPKDLLHHGGLEHREVHNAYGFSMVRSTYDGLLKRSSGRLRPFILTRSFFAGAQRFASVWTGDNTADWGHLKMSVPMLLSLSVAGIPHVGSDIGGFFGNPDPELLIRWYQAAAFQPFFRAHAHIDTRRREPWLFDNQTMVAIREAIRMRYRFLPYWYTLFYEHTLIGAPPMRPLWYEFPDDDVSYDEERQWLVGSGLLVRPVLEPEQRTVSLYLPGKEQTWYHWGTNKMHVSPGAVYSDTPLDTIPIYQRGGTIIPVRERPRRSSMAQRNDPLTLYVASELDREQANGTLYLDDGETTAYQTNGTFLYWGFYYRKQNDFLYTITSKQLNKSGTLDPDIWVERIVMRGIRYYPRNVHIYYDDYNPEDLDFEHNRENRVVVIRKPGAYVGREWRIDIHC